MAPRKHFGNGVKTFICEYSTVHQGDDMFLFGGVVDDVYTDLALKYTDDTWINLGPLLLPRRNHRSIIVSQSPLQIVHVGGSEYNKMERWTGIDALDTEHFTRQEFGPSMFDVSAYPETFLVFNDFCRV